MVGVRIQIEQRGGNIAAAIQRAALPRIEAQLRAAGVRAEQIGRELAKAELHDRPAFRRGKSGSLRYANGFRATVTSDGKRATLRLTNRAKHAPIIEKGARPHAISASGKPIPGFGTKGQHDGTQRPDVFGGPPFTRPTGTIAHPGTKPRKIIERAVRQAMREKGFHGA